MGTTTASVRLEHRFATELPELALPWQSEHAPEPRLLALDETLAAELGLDPAYLRSEEGLRLLVGNHVPEGARPVAQGYAGHQFGGYSPRLGDGRALLMGELVGLDGGLRDLHLKGSGRTPFARGGDGLAGTAQMLREHVVSQAVHALGIPTTRSLAVVATGRGVRRETVLPGAVLARVASSHLRVGSMQYARALVGSGEVAPDLLARLADVAVARHVPHLLTAEPDPARRHLALLESVVAAQASLVARWMLVGFVHGVLNTDNVLLSGETIDYGPCAFMEAYDPATVFSSIDEAGRYSYGNQPAVLEWDLARLAEAMLPLLAADQDEAIELATTALAGFRPAHAQAWSTGLAAKLGIATGPHLEPLVTDLLTLLHEGHVDWTSFFRLLASAARGDAEPVRGVFLDLAGFDAWAQRWRALGPDADAMDRVNPVHVPRNHLVEEALTAGTLGDLAPMERLLDAVTDPFVQRPGLERYAAPGPAAPTRRTAAPEAAAPGKAGPRGSGQRALTAARTAARESLASPKSRVVWGEKSSSFSMPANPGRMERLRNTTWRASSTSRMGMP